MRPGLLYVVATPIGNIEDISYRAVSILKDVDFIISEDTRETGKLLARYSIKSEQMSYRDQNHNRVYPKILNSLLNGQTAALVTDSGTPAISDPGYKLIKELQNNNIRLRPVPGPVAFTAAISVSGLPTDKVAFLGFLPKSTGQKIEILKKYGDLDCTLAIYESPYRVKKLLEVLSKTLGNRTVCLARELTKLNEEIVTSDLETLLSSNIKITEKGEFVVLVAKEGI